MSNVISKGLESNCTHQGHFLKLLNFKMSPKEVFYDSISK